MSGKYQMEFSYSRNATDWQVARFSITQFDKLFYNVSLSHRTSWREGERESEIKRTVCLLYVLFRVRRNYHCYWCVR